MSRCPQCPHCQSLIQSELSDLVLPPRPRGGGRAGIDRSFYKAFSMAYDASVARFSQPMRKIREANPGLTENQCRVYLKRARALGLVTTRAMVPDEAPAPEPVTPEPVAAQPVMPAPEPVTTLEPVIDVPAELTLGLPRPGDLTTPADDRPEWLKAAWPKWLDEEHVRWLCNEGSVSVGHWATYTANVTTPDPSTAQADAKQELQELADYGCGTFNGVRFKVTVDGPPARNKGGRPRKFSPSMA